MLIEGWIAGENGPFPHPSSLRGGQGYEDIGRWYGRLGCKSLPSSHRWAPCVTATGGADRAADGLAEAGTALDLNELGELDQEAEERHEAQSP